jgi:hypothetical protein
MRRRIGLLAPLALLALLAPAGCGRMLTAPETELAASLFGPTLDTGQVRLVRSGIVGATWRTYPARPRRTCRERIAPPRTEPTFTARPAAIALWNRVHIRADVFLADYVGRSEAGPNLAATMFLAHELTHVWQWQNRALTGYTPWRAATEHFGAADPYLFDSDGTAGFLDFSYEQQASIVEEYLCCRTLDPRGGRTARLDSLLRPVLPLPPLPTAPQPARLPWAEAPTAGICD